MAFKLKFQGKGKNPYSNIVSKGLVTPAHLIEGPGDEKKLKSKEELEGEARFKAENAPKVKLKPGEEGYDETKKASYVQKGLSKDQLEWLKNNPDYFKNNPDVQPKKASEVGEATIYSYDDKDKPEPEIDYSYLDDATFGSGSKGYTKEGKPAFYGLQLMSKAGDQLRGEEDPMSRYLTQAELDYLTKKGRIGAIGSNIGAIDYRSGYDDFYAKYKPDSKAFQLGVKRGIIDKTGKTIPLNPVKEKLEQSKNLLSETGLPDKDDPYKP